MALIGKHIHEITENDLYSIINNKIPEGLMLDYKRDMYAIDNKGKREILKDVSAFANSEGGNIVIGIDEAQGLPLNVAPVSLADPDAALLQLEGIIRTGIDPRLVGIKTRAIPVAAATLS